MVIILLLSLVADPPYILWTGASGGHVAAVENAGDINQDGTDDVFVAWEQSTRNGTALLSGLTGEIIWSENTLPGVNCTETLRSIPDFDGDRHRDLVTACESPSLLAARSGADGEYLWIISQPDPVKYLEYSCGPTARDLIILGNRVAGAGLMNTFFAVDPVTATELWLVPPQSSCDYKIMTTQGDCSGNGWSEFGYTTDRASVSSGFAVVRDGLTASQLETSYTMYYPEIDVCDSPPVMAVSQFGTDPGVWLEDIITGQQIWSIDDYGYNGRVQFIENIDGPSLPWPEILLFTGNELILINGETGTYGEWYQFPTDVRKVEFYESGSSPKLAVLTISRLTCPPLAYNPVPGYPETFLPGTMPVDLCLLNSENFPTPLAAAAMSGTGQGVCAIATSWPVSIEEETEPVLEARTVLILDESPCHGGIHFRTTGETQVDVHDVSGRLVRSVQAEEGSSHFLELPPGLYFLRYDKQNPAAVRAIVL